MSTPFNDQWILLRPEDGRAAACMPGEHSEKPHALAPPEVLPARRHERPRAVPEGALCKRPKWIDRDT